MASKDGLCEHCVTGSKKDYAGKGKDIEIDKLPAYSNGPDDAKTAVIVVTDVFGYKFPNVRLVGDKIANAGHLALIPDYLHGNVWEGDFSMENRQKFMKNNPDDRVQGDIKKTIAWLHDTKKIQSIGIIGFCWGGRQAFDASVNKDIKAVVSLHGGGVTVERANELAAPNILFACGSEDQNPTVSLCEEIQKVLKEAGKNCEVKVWKGMNHGWTMRGDEKDENVRNAANDSHEETIKFLSKHL